MALLPVVAACTSATGLSSSSSSSTSRPTSAASIEGTSPAAATEPASTATFTLAPAVDATGTVSHGTLTFAGRQRTYRLYVPHNLPTGAVPLFIGLHGGTGWADQFARTNHIEGYAESNGFIVVHPDGITIANGPGEVWNGGICCGVASRDDVDDVGFINALIDQLAKSYHIDPHRTYAFGHSNGAIMSYRLACQSADRIAGIGMYAGTLGVTACAPTQSVSILHIHGTADANIPLAGGIGTESIAGVAFPAPRASFDTVAKLDGCPAFTTTTTGNITTELSQPCGQRTAAEFVTIATANHSWPGGTPIVTPAAGPAYAGYDATGAIVAFLLAHPRSSRS